MQCQLALQIAQVVARAPVLARDDLVAGANVAGRLAKRQMHRERQRLRKTADIAPGQPRGVRLRIERFHKAVKGRVRGVALRGPVKLPDQGG